jgi:hypothetical protein
VEAINDVFLVDFGDDKALLPLAPEMEKIIK